MLFNEPKLLKSVTALRIISYFLRFSALQRAEIAEINLLPQIDINAAVAVSVLFNEPKLLKLFWASCGMHGVGLVSVLFNEPKLLK